MDKKEQDLIAEWSSKKKQNVSIKILKELVEKQKGLCALTRAKLNFEKNCGRIGGNGGCHPLFASIDHKSPLSKDKDEVDIEDVQIVCYAINDMKGHLPEKLFNVIIKSDVWKKFANGWKDLSVNGKDEIEKFKDYIKNFDL